MKRIVCDTGPLVHLFEANLLKLLEAAGEILIPPGVANELEGVAPELRLGELPWLLTRPLRQPHDAEARDWHRAGLLHLGEAEALALARQEQADWLLTDDSAARVVTERMAVEVHGSLATADPSTTPSGVSKGASRRRPRLHWLRFSVTAAAAPRRTTGEGKLPVFSAPLVRPSIRCRRGGTAAP